MPRTGENPQREESCHHSIHYGYFSLYFVGFLALLGNYSRGNSRLPINQRDAGTC